MPNRAVIIVCVGGFNRLSLFNPERICKRYGCAGDYRAYRELRSVLCHRIHIGHKAFMQGELLRADAGAVGIAPVFLEGV